MSEAARWVQHVSGQGEKLKIYGRSDFAWCVSRAGGIDQALYYLPLSEYRLCDPPEAWKDVTAAVQYAEDKFGIGRFSNGDESIHTAMSCSTKYRFRKVLLAGSLDNLIGRYAFIVERRESAKEK